MNSDSGQIKIDQLHHGNYHAWKIRIQHLLNLKGLEDFIVDNPPSDPEQLKVWKKKDGKAQATIGLSLSDDMLENVRDVSSAKDMWNCIKNVFERHTLLNKLSARRKFYTATMADNEPILKFSNRIRQLASTLKNMSVPISESEMAMALLNGLPDEYHSLISALDTIDSDGRELSWDHVKSRVLQEEQRINARTRKAQEKSDAAALVTANPSNLPLPAPSCKNCRRRPPRQRPFCNHCNRHGHVESKCFIKHPHLNPRKKSAFIASQGDEDPAVCLMAKYESSNTPSNSGDWFVDSACSIHMTYDKSLFSSYTPGNYSPVRLGNCKTAEVSGSGSIALRIIVNGRIRDCTLQTVLHVPSLGYQLLSVPTLDKSGYTTIFESGRVFIRSNNFLLATATLRGNLYRLDTSNELQKTALVSVDLDTWHKRLAHVSPITISEMSKKNVVQGLHLEPNSQFTHCEGCFLGKGHRSPIPKASKSKSQKLLELVHSDVNGPMETPHSVDRSISSPSSMITLNGQSCIR